MEPHRGDENRHHPTPSIWPVGFAVGIACILAGLVVSFPALIAGVVIAAIFGFLWARDAMATPISPSVGREDVRDVPAETVEPLDDDADRYPRNKFLELTTLGLGGATGTGAVVTAVTATRWEVGGEFHLPVEPPGPFHRWPDGAVWFALGRHAVQGLLRRLGSPRLWVPDYFCQEVARSWAEVAAEVEVYEDDPRWPEPRWESLQPLPRDVVIAVNYFGVREGGPWAAWRARTDCVLLEDHAHDPASEWANASQADYAFSSLRKTLPVPDGAILWSPRDLPLPDQPAGGADGSELKLAAMLLKGEYLSGGEDALKERFRQLQLDGEARLADSDVAGAAPATREALVRGVPLPWRAKRAENTARLIAALHDWELAEPVFTTWPADAAPLGAAFVFGSGADRDRVREVMREGDVYCPVHWADAAESDNARVRELAGRILTIPTDWRYSAGDIARIAALAQSA